MALQVDGSKCKGYWKVFVTTLMELRSLIHSILLNYGCCWDDKQCDLKSDPWSQQSTFSFSCDEAKWSLFARFIQFIVSLFSQFAAKWQLEGGKFYFCWRTSVTDPKLFAPNPSASYNRRWSKMAFAKKIISISIWFKFPKSNIDWFHYSPLCIFKYVLKLLACKDIKSHWLQFVWLFSTVRFQMSLQMACLWGCKVT